MHGGPSGFQNARVTRAIVVAAAVFTVFVGLRDRSSSVGLSYQDIFQNFNFWRLISSIFAFSSTPELMFGLYLLYYFRVFERQIGSNKYSVFTLFSVIVASLFVILALALLKDPSLTILSLGPYGLIFASFVPFYFDIPVSTLFHIFGLRFSNKAFVYLAGFQLLLSSWKRTLLPGVCGILAGSLYRLNILGIRRLKFPRIVTGLFSWFSHSSSGHTMPRPSGMSTLRNLTSHTDRQIEVPRNYPSTRPASTVEPSEDSIATLVSMGFDRNSARQALVQSQNDMNMATNMLLEAQSH